MDEKERGATRRKDPKYLEYQRRYQAAYYHRTKERNAARLNSPERKEYMKEYRRANRLELRKKARDSERKRLYGLTPEQFQAMLEKQGHECPICTRLLTKPVVDHWHGTKQVRGILCRNCNAALGLFEDNMDHLERAIEYLSSSWSGATSTTSKGP
jgi:hypothetical protein